MKKSLLVLFIICLSNTLLAQYEVTIEAFVLDKETKQPIPYVNIGFIEKSIGTVSNEDGKFTLIYHEDIVGGKEFLQFSVLGYKTLKVRASQLVKFLTNTNKFYLIPEPVELEEVFIANETRNKKRIGNTNIVFNMMGYWKDEDVLGGEITTKIKIKKKQTKLLDLKFNIIENTSDSIKVLLAIFAHPDDETTISPILARYVREGIKVHLVIATDGRLGVNDHTDHEAGEGLVAMRKEEMKCAASELGVELHHLNYHDQLKSGEGYDGHMPQARALIKEIYGLVETIKPDVIITWGPDGSSNHIDHRLISATVTQVLVSKVWDNPFALYYYGNPSENIEDAEAKILRGQDKKYLATQIAYTEEDLKHAYNSRACHKTQMQATTFEAYKEGKAKNGMLIYLRKFESESKMSSSVFE